jgi:protein-disulfide isomerase
MTASVINNRNSFWAVSALLLASITTNAYFAHRFVFPQWYREVRLWFVAPPEPKLSDHSRGSESASVTIIEYGDFQCPYCARFHGVLRELTQTDDVRWMFRHYTLNPGHPEAHAAANAAECAGDQGRFWEYTDALYENHAALGAETYVRLADQLHLQTDQFRSCMAATPHQAVIEADNAEADKLEFIGVPTWFVNGKRISGAMSLDDARKILNDAKSRL